MPWSSNDQRGTNHCILLSNETGGILHIHDSTVTPLEFIIDDASYRHQLYICSSSSSGPLIFKFAAATPNNIDGCHWELVSERRSREGAHQFDAFLRSQFSLFTDDPEGNRNQ